MAVTLHDLLQPQTVLDVVSRMAPARHRLGQWFGFHTTTFNEADGLTGPGTTSVPQNEGVYRLYDNVREVAHARAPGTGPALVNPRPVGEVAYSMIRIHEKIRLEYAKLDRLSAVVGPNTVVDKGGQDYIARQLKTLMQRVANSVELATWGMTRGTLFLKGVGESFVPTLTAPAGGTPTVTINYQMPAGNKTQLNMLGAGDIINTTWANVAADIPTDLMQINQAFANLCGDALTDVWINGIGWMNVINNTAVKAQAGTANTPFAAYDRVPETRPGGQAVAEATAVLRAFPWLTWHIVDEFLVNDENQDPVSGGTGALVNCIPDTNALFVAGKPDRMWTDCLQGGEHISENVGMPATFRQGFHYWYEYKTQPTCIELCVLYNFLPRYVVPKKMAFGTVVF